MKSTRLKERPGLLSDVNQLFKVCAVFVTFAVAECCNAAACDYTSEHVMHAIDQHDYEVLKTINCDADDSVEWSMLSEAIVQSMLGNDENAEVALQEVMATSNDPAITARALRSLSGVMVRQGRFSEAVEAMNKVIELDSDGVTINDQSVAFFSALAGTSPMRTIISGPGEIAARRDKANLPRLPIKVNGMADDAIFDTGAAFSTVTVSTANKMRLRQLGEEVGVAASTDNTVQSGLAIASELVVGTARFLDVPFIVVPDDAMAFPDFDYAITSVLGLPVIARLGRIEWSATSEGEIVKFEKTSVLAEIESANMITSGWQVVALASIDEYRSRLRFFLDTGARRSALHGFAEAALPELSLGTTRESRTIGGLGGVVEEDVLVVPSLTLKIGKTRLEVGPIHMHPDDGSFRHGVLGQDILTRFRRVVLDFDSMKFLVSDQVL